MSTKTLLQMAQEVATEIRFPQITQVFGNSDKNVVAIFDAIKKATERDVFRSNTWAEMVGTSNIIDTNTRSDHTWVYALPDNFDSMIRESAWDNTRDLPIVGGLTTHEWNDLIYSNDNLGTQQLYFRIFLNERTDDGDGGTGLTYYEKSLQIARVENGDSVDIAFSYRKKYYVVDPTTGAPKSDWEADTDITVFDSELIVLAATVRMLRSLGRSYGDQANELTALMKERRLKDGAHARKIDIGRGKIVDYINTPGYPMPARGRRF